MRPLLGWTMLSRTEMRQVERSLANSEQDTRDEIGFLLIHQGFADRFFPGTSVLHTRIRYALFVPWVYLQATSARRRGSDLDSAIRRLLVQLAIRLKQIGGERYDVIGGDKLGQLTSQPPDRVYWTALRSWGMLLPSVESRQQVLHRLTSGTRAALLDDDGGRLDDEIVEVFSSLPEMPKKWDDPESPLQFRLSQAERDYLRRKLTLLPRPNDTSLSLLARLAAAKATFDGTAPQLPRQLDAYADGDDKRALRLARDAAALTAIGRAVYGALVEQLLEQDGGPRQRTFRDLLPAHFAQYGEAATHFDLTAAEFYLRSLPEHVRRVLQETHAYISADRPEQFFRLRDAYQAAEVRRKTARRARLADWPPSAQRRAEWVPARHNTRPLHYRWTVVQKMLGDLGGSA